MATLIDHKKAHFDYEILTTYEAGMELSGQEVKALKSKHGSLLGAYVVVRGGEAFLLNANIPPYQPGNAPDDYDPLRTRRLLLTKKELGELAGEENKSGLTIIPLSVYNKGKVVKIQIGIARGKKKYDKRETIKKREAGREIDRTLKKR